MSITRFSLSFILLITLAISSNGVSLAQLNVIDLRNSENSFNIHQDSLKSYDNEVLILGTEKLSSIDNLGNTKVLFENTTDIRFSSFEIDSQVNEYYLVSRNQKLYKLDSQGDFKELSFQIELKSIDSVVSHAGENYLIASRNNKKQRYQLYRIQNEIELSKPLRSWDIHKFSFAGFISEKHFILVNKCFNVLANVKNKKLRKISSNFLCKKNTPLPHEIEDLRPLSESSWSLNMVNFEDDGRTDLYINRKRIIKDIPCHPQLQTGNYYICSDGFPINDENAFFTLDKDSASELTEILNYNSENQQEKNYFAAGRFLISSTGEASENINIIYQVYSDNIQINPENIKLNEQLNLIPNLNFNVFILDSN